MRRSSPGSSAIGVAEETAEVIALPTALTRETNSAPVAQRRAVAYVRESTEEQGKGFSPEGQRQAIAVARAVYSNARILLLDEPLAAMGAREAGLIIDLIDRLKARGDIANVMIAHNYAQTLEICDRIMLMQHGTVTYERDSAATSVTELMEIVRREYRARRSA